MKNHTQTETLTDTLLSLNEVFLLSELKETGENSPTSQKAKLLLLLEVEGPLSIENISERLSLSRDEADKIIEDLLIQNYLELELKGNSHEGVTVCLTDTGFSLAARYTELESFLGTLSSEDQSLLSSYLKQSEETKREQYFSEIFDGLLYGAWDEPYLDSGLKDYIIEW